MSFLTCSASGEKFRSESWSGLHALRSQSSDSSYLGSELSGLFPPWASFCSRRRWRSWGWWPTASSSSWVSLCCSRPSGGWSSGATRRADRNRVQLKGRECSKNHRKIHFIPISDSVTAKSTRWKKIKLSVIGLLQFCWLASSLWSLLDMEPKIQTFSNILKFFLKFWLFSQNSDFS